MSSYSTVSGGGIGEQTALPASGPILNTPDVINSIIDIMNPFERHYLSGSPASEDSSGSTCSAVSPPRMQNICTSLLIKEELKMAIRSKQRNAVAATTTASAGSSPMGNGSMSGMANVGSTASTGSAASSPGGGQAKKRRTDEESHGDDDDEDDVSSHGEGLTAEDEERRRRRRERNKIAATKCRLKKREKTTNLMQESEVLSTKNDDLKTAIQRLETQKNDLMKMLATHPCAREGHPQQHQHLQHHQQQQQQQQQQPYHHQQQHIHELQYKAEQYANDPYHQHHHAVGVAAEPPIIKDAMFNGGGGYAAAGQSSSYNRTATTTAATVAAVHYPIVGSNSIGINDSGVGGGGGGGVYTSCVDDLYGYNKDLITGGNGGPSDLSHQYYDQGIC